MAKGTSLKENIDMLKEEVVNFPKGRILHKGLNIIVEWVRANPKKAFFIGLAAIAVTAWFFGTA